MSWPRTPGSAGRASSERRGGDGRASEPDDLFTDEELSWEDETGERPATEQALPRWPIARRAPDGGSAPFRRRRLIAGAAVAVLAVIGIVLAVTLSGGGTKQTATSTPLPNVSTPTTTAAPPPPAKPQVTLPGGTALKEGSSGSAVKSLQRALATLGFAVGKADGTYGPKTKAAVIAFQQKHKLTADGVVGKKTAAALNAALESG